MNEVGGSESGTGLRAIKSSRSSDANFEYDDSEWDVGIGNLIIDLDADIEKNNEANRNNNNSSSTGTGTSSGGATGGSVSGNNLQQMHIPLTSSSGSNSNNKSGKSSGGNGNNPITKSATSTTSSSSSDLSTVMEHSSIVDKGLKMKIKRTKTGTKSGADAKHEIVKNDVVGSSNGTTGGNSSTNSNYSSNKSISDSISTKNSHSSHKEKDKLLIKDSLLHDNLHDHSGSINNATSGKDGEHGGGTGKVKTPRKGSTKEKKTKNSGSNVGNSGNSKKDEKNELNSKSLSNSGSGNSNTGSSGTHAKDNKEFFSTTVNLNVPNVIPNSSSSAFVKATATIKVPTAPTSSSSVLSSSSSGLHNVHTSGGDSSSTSRSQSLSANNSSASNNSNSPWGTVSPSKGADKGRLSPSASALSNTSEKSTGNSYNKKGRAFAAADKTGTGSTQDENSAGSHGGSLSNASYRNQGALGINSATDLSTGSSNFVQGVPATQPGNGGTFGSPKEVGKGGRSTGPSTQDVCIGTSVGTVTEPDCLGPCEPGTSVTLEGIVWHETESGVLVVNVTWRGKTYVGTLIDCTKNDWAPPRFCDSPASDLEMRTPKNRGKRGRAQATTPVNEPVVADTRSANAKLRNGAKGRRGSNTATAFVAPASPVKPDPWPKRKTRGSENESQEEVIPKNAKRLKVSKDSERKERRSNSPAADNEKSGPSSPQLIECPEPNCNKKYTHMNGLRYHLNHAHSNNVVTQEDSDSNMSTASTSNTATLPEPTASNNANDTVEPMVVDGSESPDNSTQKNATSNSITDDPPSAPSTPVKKPTSTIVPPKVDDKIYDMSSDADLNPSKDSSSSQDGPEPYSKVAKVAAANKPPPPSKDVNNDSDSKLIPENLSKDSSSSSSSSPTSTTSTTPTTTSTPTLTPRTPILTVPVVPSYMSLQNRNNMVHGHVVNVPRVEPRESTENSGSPLKPSGAQGSVPTSKNAPWQPHAQTGLSQHVMNASPPSQSINVPLNIPMNISEKLGGITAKEKDKSGSIPDQTSSKKNKHKKKSKDRDKERDGKSKDKDKQDMANKSLNIPMSGGPSDYSRSSGMFHNSNIISERSKEMSSSDENDTSRKNSLENRDDPQSPAYSDISDANDSGPDAELNVGSVLKDTACKGLVIPGEIKKDPIVPSVPGGAPPYQFFNHNLHSPYLDSLSYAASRQQNKDGTPPVTSNVPEEPEKTRPSAAPLKHPSIPPANSQAPSTSTVLPASGPPPPPPPPPEDARRSPKMDFSKYPYPNYFSYPYSGYHPYENNPFTNSLPPSENSFNPSNQGRMFPGMEDREKEVGPGGNLTKGDKPGEKDEVPGNVQIKQEPIEREERRGKESRAQPSALSMSMGEEKSIEVKKEFGSDHSEPKLLPPYMSNNSNKHLSKEHSKRDDRHDRHDRHDRRHDGKDHDSKAEKSSRNTSSNNDKSKGLEESEPKERKDEGAKPTMETTGPPPPPTASAYYLAQSYLPSNPFGIPFDPSHPLYRQMLVPGHYPGSPYMHPGSLPRFPSPGGPTPLPEDLSRHNPGGPPGNPSKALDLLQHHAAQYYSSHKIHELQERALKSPSPQVVAAQRAERDGPPSMPGGPGGPPASSSPGGHPLGGGPGNVPHSVGGGRSSVGSTSSSSSIPKPADLSKDSKPTIGPGGTLLPGGPNSDNVRTPPPTQHHVHSHTHHHTHVGIGYPIIPTVPPQYSPHYGVLATPPAAPSVIPPFPAQKPN